MQLIKQYFPGLTSEQHEKFARLEELYLDWNQKINVISRKDIQHFYLHHVLHSLSIARVFAFADKTSIIDIGTGGGFPGIPLAIFFPRCSFCLVDSINKKIKVVQAVADSLGLTNVKYQWSRGEKVNHKFDFVVARAVTALPGFVDLTQKRISKKHKNKFRNGIIYLKGGDFEEETRFLHQKKLPVKLYTLSEYFEEDFFTTKKIVYIPLGKS